MFLNPKAEEVAKLLRDARTIAVVSLSPEPDAAEALWLQESVVDEKAAARAVQAGIFTVIDRCLFKERAALRD